MLKAEWPVEAGNAVIKDGSMPRKVKAILDDLKPEAAYFLPLNGKRCAVLFLDIKEPSELPAIVEPWFQAVNASVQVVPAMTVEDLMKAGPAIAKAVKQYG